MQKKIYKANENDKKLETLTKSVDVQLYIYYIFIYIY